MKKKGKSIDIEFETMKQDIITMIQNSNDKIKVSRVYEALTGNLTRSHPTHPSQIRVIT